MSEKLPILKPEQLITVLIKLGFENTRKSKGSHWRFCHSDGRKTTVPVHQGKTTGRGLLRKILRDIEITVEELKLLKKKLMVFQRRIFTEYFLDTTIEQESFCKS